MGYVVLATFVRWLLDPYLGDHLPYVTYFVVVTLAAWSCGVGPSVVCLVLGFLATTYCFSPPRHTLLIVDPQHWVGSFTYFFVGITDAFFVGAMRAAQRRATESARHALDKQQELEREVQEREQAEAELRQMRAELEGRVAQRTAELTRANEALRAEAAERHRTEEALRESEQRFARFMQHLPGLAWIKDSQGRYVYANEAAERAFRTPRAQLYGRTDEEVFPPEVAAQFKMNDRRALAGGAGVQVVETLEHEDGVLHYSLVSKFSIPGVAGQAPLVGGMAIDITDRKRAEEELRHHTQLLKNIADYADSALVMLDGRGHCTFVNPAFTRITGYTEDDIRGKTVHEVLHYQYPDGRPFSIEECPLYQAYLGGRGLRGHEDVFLRRDGTSFPVVVSVAPTEPGGAAVGGVVEFRDVTREKEAERVLQDADRRKDEFLATVAHELRNPLAPLRNGLQIMRLMGTGGAAVEQARTMMERQFQQLVRLIDDLLDVNRITRNKLELRKERIELAVAVRNAVEIARPLIEQQGHQLEVTLPEEPVFVDADLTRLAQVFTNLLNNAAKYSERGGRIWLTAERQGSDAVVRVKDTGVGIAADMLPRIFEMFTQVDRSLERSQGGLGIGLALVQRLVEMHGGSVEASSEGVGKGSEFVVRLPLVIVRHARPEASESECGGTPAAGRCKVLVVDDDPDAVSSLGMMLRLMGHDVCTAQDGREAVAVAASYRPDVVLLDIGLPRLNGYEAARLIRAEPWGRDMSLIALTGWSQEEDRRRSQETGFDHHMVKPLDPAALEKLLGKLCPAPA